MLCCFNPKSADTHFIIVFPCSWLISWLGAQQCTPCNLLKRERKLLAHLLTRGRLQIGLYYGSVWRLIIVGQRLWIVRPLMRCLEFLVLLCILLLSLERRAMRASFLWCVMVINIRRLTCSRRAEESTRQGHLLCYEWEIGYYYTSRVRQQAEWQGWWRHGGYNYRLLWWWW